MCYIQSCNINILHVLNMYVQSYNINYYFLI